MSRNLIQILVVLLLISSKSICQTEEFPTKEQIKNLSDFRSNLLLNNTEEIIKLNKVLNKFSQNDLRSETFSEMISKILLYKNLYHFSTRMLSHSFEKKFPNVKVSEKITASDIYTIAKNNELLELILAQVLKPNFPYSLSRNTNFFKEYSFYEISKGDRVGEIGAGLGEFSLLLAIIDKQIELTVNELNDQRLNYIQKKFEFHSKYIENDKIKIIKGDKRLTNFETRTYDKIIIRNSFHHFKKKKDMLESIRKSLKKDGALYLYEPFIGYTTSEDPCKKIMDKEKFLNLMEENDFHLEKTAQLDAWYLLKYTVKK